MDSEPVPTAAVAPAERSRLLADFVTLTKPRVNLLVLVTTVIGFHLGNRGGATDLALLLNTVIGTFLVASGAAAQPIIGGSAPGTAPTTVASDVTRFSGV